LQFHRQLFFEIIQLGAAQADRDIGDRAVFDDPSVTVQVNPRPLYLPPAQMRLNRLLEHLAAQHLHGRSDMVFYGGAGINYRAAPPVRHHPGQTG
jgi:hypothetical protein